MNPFDDVQDIALAQLTDHPDNVRYRMEDRGEILAALTHSIQTRGHLGPEHMLLVRPYQEGYQIIAGHVRVAACRAAGLTTAICKIEAMEDIEASHRLWLENLQTAPPLLGLALWLVDHVELGTAGRGQKGGLREYARVVGKTEMRCHQLYSAGLVAINCKIDFTIWQDKTTHLYELSKANKAIWPLLCTSLLSSAWTVKDTQAHVDDVNAFLIPDHWAFFLPLQEVIERHLKTQRFSASTVEGLCQIATALRELLTSEEHVGAYWAEACAWLVAHKDNDAWDVRKLEAYRLEWMERLKEAGDNQWLRGDWRDHIDALEDGTVALLFTDPPYGKAYRSDWRPGGKHKPNPHPQQIINDGEEEAVSELEAMLEAIFPKLIANAHLLIFVDPAKWEIVKAQVLRQGFTYRGQLVWDKTIGGMGDLKTTFAPQHELILHAVKGSPLVYSREPSVLSHPRPNGITRLPDGTSRHPHEKPVPLLHRLMMATTVKKHTVADPFGGVASMCEAALLTARRYWSCEIDEHYYKIGELRLQGIQKSGFFLQ